MVKLDSDCNNFEFSGYNLIRINMKCIFNAFPLTISDLIKNNMLSLCTCNIQYIQSLVVTGNALRTYFFLMAAMFFPFTTYWGYISVELRMERHFLKE